MSTNTTTTHKPEVPILKDLTIDNITDNVHLINAQTGDARLKYVLERLVTHLHDFARETRLSTSEWMAGIEFLTAVGKKCTDLRQVRCLSLSFLLMGGSFFLSRGGCVGVGVGVACLIASRLAFFGV